MSNPSQVIAAMDKISEGNSSALEEASVIRGFLESGLPGSGTLHDRIENSDFDQSTKDFLHGVREECNDTIHNSSKWGYTKE